MSNTIRMKAVIDALAALKAIEAMTGHDGAEPNRALWNIAMNARCSIEADVNLFDPIDVTPTTPTLNTTRLL